MRKGKKNIFWIKYQEALIQGNISKNELEEYLKKISVSWRMFRDDYSKRSIENIDFKIIVHLCQKLDIYVLDLYNQVAEDKAINKHILAEKIKTRHKITLPSEL